ncbi:hypothetical protein DP116_25410 [Brasilonema bromeliae SPC951]|uniref:Uncharacterized protein n=1 Tax=Brasilonema bromeliae SPC951 TaxID=385972 RepID=A0ABX1PDP6_9CYAN|nr:hypothetical protein [Brasilonema bromeliae SPC951]
MALSAALITKLESHGISAFAVNVKNNNILLRIVQVLFTNRCANLLSVEYKVKSPVTNDSK